MSSLTPSKRHDQSPKESNGNKSRKLASCDSQSSLRKTSSGGAVFRILCPSSDIENVVGKGGDIISDICQETGAKIRIDDPVPGCDERVIFFMDPDKDTENSEQTKTEKDLSSKEQDGSNNQNENDAEKEILSNDGGSHSEITSPSVQKALLLMFEKIIEGEKETDGDKESNGSMLITFRLLVLSSQVGCILGKGGSVIKQMSGDSGAQIRVLPRDKLPKCASTTDDVVQITGGAGAVKMAIKLISDQIMENLPHENDSFPSKPSGHPSHSHSHPLLRPDSRPIRSFPPMGPPFAGGFHDGGDFRSNVPSLHPNFRENFMPNRMDVPEIFTFRLLCPDERVGGVIGKGGAIIKTLQHESGCEIKVLEGNSDGEERMIIVSGPTHPDDRISMVQDAVLRVLHRIAKAIPDSKEKGVTAKFLVSSNQIGCLLGKGGSIIAEMRKITGAHIRILGKEQIPKCASENEEVVQISGELQVVQEAVLQITTRLQHHYFRDAFPSMNHPSNPGFMDRGPPFPSFMGRRELSPPGMFPKLGPSFRNFDSVGGPPPHGVFHPLDDHPRYMNDALNQGIPRPWHLPAPIEGGSMGLMDHKGVPQRPLPGFGGESQQAVITNTTVEVVVPSSLVPSIYGENGGCLRQIHQISDAKIMINDPKPGEPETAIIISGTPEQTHAAQSLIQAFVMLENESS